MKLIKNFFLRYANVHFLQQNTDMSPESYMLLPLHLTCCWHKTLLVCWYKFKFNFVFPRCFCLSLSYFKARKGICLTRIFPKAFTLIYAFDSFFPVYVASFSNTIHSISLTHSTRVINVFYFFQRFIVPCCNFCTDFYCKIIQKSSQNLPMKSSRFSYKNCIVADIKFMLLYVLLCHWCANDQLKP